MAAFLTTRLDRKDTKFLPFNLGTEDDGAGNPVMPGKHSTSYIWEHILQRDMLLRIIREFMFVDDLAELCVFLMNNYSGNETVNAGTGKEITIKELSELVAKTVGYEGKIVWDTTKPNGTPRKLLDVSKAEALGWKYHTELEEGLKISYEDFLNNPMRAER